MLSGDQEETFEEFTARYVAAALSETTTSRDALRQLRARLESLNWMTGSSVLTVLGLE
jgi:hypothetical protein